MKKITEPAMNADSEDTTGTTIGLGSAEGTHMSSNLTAGLGLQTPSSPHTAIVEVVKFLHQKKSIAPSRVELYKMSILGSTLGTPQSATVKTKVKITACSYSASCREH